MSGGDPARYAIYFAPAPASPLARFGASWLGYDAAIGERVAQPPIAEIAAERLDAITAEPRLYGFHATLKPPFALAASAEPDALAAKVATLAGKLSAFDAPPLRLLAISGFLALALSPRCPRMHDLAARCVGELDEFRAPASEAELARRRGAGLSPTQERMLRCWGYPYVMDEFRFHITLSGRLDPAERESVRRVLEPRVAPLCREALRVDAICLFRQESRAAPFRVVRRYTLRTAGL